MTHTVKPKKLPTAKTPKNRKSLKVHPFPEDMGISNEKYETYLKEHNAKLRRLRREQMGLNMVEPE